MRPRNERATAPDLCDASAVPHNTAGKKFLAPVCTGKPEKPSLFRKNLKRTLSNFKKNRKMLHFGVDGLRHR
jgi:hypothetical protein